MSAAVVVPFGRELLLLPPDRGEPRRFPTTATPRPAVSLRAADVPAPLVESVARLPVGTELAAAPRTVREALAQRTGRPVRPADDAEWHRVRRAILAPGGAEERRYLREIAGRDLEQALRSPAEVLITLAREEERLERAVGREERASEAMLAVPDAALTAYRERWSDTRARLAEHHRSLLASVEESARSVVPNLAAVVGPRVAARLVAAAGGVEPLGRMRAARLQLLGTKRRPAPDRGPRFGVIYRAERMPDVPIDRRAAYARSLGALAAIAVRADASTRRDIAPLLVRRRDRRIDELRRGRA